MCGETDVHLHHMTYERIGEERLTDLTPLCAHCHSLIHVLEFRGDIALDLAGLFNEGRAAEGRALLASLVAHQERERAQRREAEQQEVLGLSYAARLVRVSQEAKYKRRIDISSELHVLKHMVKQGRSNATLTRHLRRIEERVYGWDGWQEAA